MTGRRLRIVTGSAAEDYLAAIPESAAPTLPPVAVDAIAPPSDLETVYAQDLGRLTGLAEWMTGSRSIAEELVHDAFVRAVSKPPKLEDPGALRAYMRSSVVNACNSRLRRFAVERKHRTARAVSYDDPPRPDEDVRNAVRQLPLRQRQVIVLRFYEDMTIEQVAAELSIGAGSVKTHLHRALKNVGNTVSEGALS